MAQKAVRRSRGKHGRTRCQWCDAKISRGRSFCNEDHRQAHKRFNTHSPAPAPVEPKPEPKRNEEQETRLMRALFTGRFD